MDIYSNHSIKFKNKKFLLSTKTEETHVEKESITTESYVIGSILSTKNPINEILHTKLINKI